MERYSDYEMLKIEPGFLWESPQFYRWVKTDTGSDFHLGECSAEELMLEKAYYSFVALFFAMIIFSVGFHIGYTPPFILAIVAKVGAKRYHKNKFVGCKLIFEGGVCDVVNKESSWRIDHLIEIRIINWHSGERSEIYLVSHSAEDGKRFFPLGNTDSGQFKIMGRDLAVASGCRLVEDNITHIAAAERQCAKK